MDSKRLWKWAGLVGFVVLVLGVLRGCSPAVDPWAQTPGSPRVLTSFSPIYCFAKNVAGEDVGVLCLTITKGPHEFKDPIAGDILKVRKSDLFLINGLGLDEVVAKKLKNNSGSTRLEIVEVGEVISDDKRLHLGEHGHHHGHDHAKEGKGHGAPEDPHVWLGIPEAKQVVDKICTELQRIDPKRKDQYAANAKAYKARLDDLLKYGKEQLGNKHHHVITMHDSMGYFAKSFDLEVVDSIQVEPGEDPSAKKLAELIDKGSKEKVRVVCHEPQYPADVAKTLLAGLKSKNPDLEPALAQFDPLETAENPRELYENPRWYEERMKANIDNLAKALK
jgi:ABC-type Zn uptake system ZnuABC Zn-binding protein ZnuA